MHFSLQLAMTGVNDAAASGVSSSHAYTLHARLSYAWRAAAYVQRAALPCNFSEQSQLTDSTST